MSELSRILTDVGKGDVSASAKLLPLVYEELRRLAAHRMAHERIGHTLQPTALVHEAYLRLVRSEDQSWENRGHFFSAAAEAMRRILVEAARRKKRVKHGGEHKRMHLDQDDIANPSATDHLIELDEALSRLELEDPNISRLVNLRYFGGMQLKEAAKTLGISTRTANRNWAYACAWLQHEIQSLREGT